MAVFNVLDRPNGERELPSRSFLSQTNVDLVTGKMHFSTAGTTRHSVFVAPSTLPTML